MDEFRVDTAYEIAGFVAAGGRSTAAHVPKSRGKHCMGADDTCKGFKSKGTDFCIGHLRSLAKADK